MPIQPTISTSAPPHWCDSLLLDMDGTLVDSLPGIQYSALEALSICGAAPVMQDFRSLVGPPIRDILATVSGRSESAELDVLERAFRSVYDGGAWQKATLYPGVRDALEAFALSGLRLFVVTNKPGIPARRILKHLGLWPLITALCCPDHREPAFKTKAEAAKYLHEEWLLDPDRTLLVGDSRDDAHAAAICGFRFAGVEYGYGAACSQGDFPVHFRLLTFAGLMPVIYCNPSPNPSTPTQSTHHL